MAKLGRNKFDLEQTTLEDEPVEYPELNQLSLKINKRKKMEDASSASGDETQHQSKEDRLAMKNIIKNYARAIASFALSELFLPYVEETPEKKLVRWEEFINYTKKARSEIQNIDCFRDYLLIRKGDSQELVAMKKLFQLAGITFIKYFSVNWIFSGKIVYKLFYLKFRGKLLRRIQNPKLFTYISA